MVKGKRQKFMSSSSLLKKPCHWEHQRSWWCNNPGYQGTWENYRNTFTILRPPAIYCLSLWVSHILLVLRSMCPEVAHMVLKSQSPCTASKAKATSLTSSLIFSPCSSALASFISLRFLSMARGSSPRTFTLAFLSDSPVSQDSCWLPSLHLPICRTSRSRALPQHALCPPALSLLDTMAYLCLLFLSPLEWKPHEDRDGVSIHSSIPGACTQQGCHKYLLHEWAVSSFHEIWQS